MQVLINILVGLVAILHVWFLVLEMFLWTKPIGLKVFKQTIERAESSAVLAANQGLYNGFLAVGLAWSLMQPQATTAQQLKIFFLSCVVVAGVYGAYSVSRKILYIQAGPAMLALIAIALI